MSESSINNLKKIVTIPLAMYQDNVFVTLILELGAWNGPNGLVAYRRDSERSRRTDDVPLSTYEIRERLDTTWSGRNRDTTTRKTPVRSVDNIVFPTVLLLADGRFRVARAQLFFENVSPATVDVLSRNYNTSYARSTGRLRYRYLPLAYLRGFHGSPPPTPRICFC